MRGRKPEFTGIPRFGGRGEQLPRSGRTAGRGDVAFGEGERTLRRVQHRQPSDGVFRGSGTGHLHVICMRGLGFLFSLVRVPTGLRSADGHPLPWAGGDHDICCAAHRLAFWSAANGGPLSPAKGAQPECRGANRSASRDRLSRAIGVDFPGDGAARGFNRKWSSALEDRSPIPSAD